jgi:hypothetical protein
MSKYKRGHQQSVDKNELEIIKALEAKGCFVVRGMDDFLAYCQREGYFNPDAIFQVEVKNESPFNKNGTLKVGKIKDSQYKMLCYANDFYLIGWTTSGIIDYIYDINFPKDIIINPTDFQNNYKEWLTPKELNRLRQKKWWSLG